MGDLLKHVVLRANPVGTALANMLTEAGAQVGLFSVMGNSAYDMPGTTPMVIDGADTEKLGEGCDGADVIYLCTTPER